MSIQSDEWLFEKQKSKKRNQFRFFFCLNQKLTQQHYYMAIEELSCYDLNQLKWNDFFFLFYAFVLPILNTFKKKFSCYFFYVTEQRHLYSYFRVLFLFYVTASLRMKNNKIIKTGTNIYILFLLLLLKQTAILFLIDRFFFSFLLYLT